MELIMGKPMNLETSVVFSTLPDVEKVFEEPSSFSLASKLQVLWYPIATPSLEPGTLSPGRVGWWATFKPCWAVPPMGLEAWNAKWLWNLFSFLSCDRHRNRGWRGGWLSLACRWSWVQSHHGCLVGYFSGASSDAGSLVLGTPRFCEKSQALSKRGRRMDHRDLVAGAQVRVLHGAWSLARFFFFWGGGRTSGVESHKSWFSGNLLFFFLKETLKRSYWRYTQASTILWLWEEGRRNYETHLIVLLVCRTVSFFVWR